MNSVEYPNFIVRTVNSNITIDNFYKQDYNVYSIDNIYMFTIYRTFISKSVAERLCSDNKFNSLYSYEDIESFKDACNILNLNYKDIQNIVCELNKTSHTLAAIFKLKIIRNALNGEDSIKLTEGTIYVPCVHFIPKIVIPKRLQDKFKVIGEFNNNNTQYLVLGK